MADYDRAELERLQAEAAQRIREMHSRAQPQPENQPSENASYTDMPGMPPMPSFIKLPREQQPRKNSRPAPQQNGGYTDGGRPAPAEGPAPRASETRPEPRPEPRSGSHSPPSKPSQPKSPPPRRQEHTGPYVPPQPRRTGMDLMQMLNFKNIDLDGDRTLILLILLLLSGEENDQYMTLALLYLLM